MFAESQALSIQKGEARGPTRHTQTTIHSEKSKINACEISATVASKEKNKNLSPQTRKTVEACELRN